MLEPYYTIGPTGSSGNVIWTRHGKFITLIASMPGIMHENPKHPHRSMFGGWSFGIFGVNVWVRWRFWPTK